MRNNSNYERKIKGNIKLLPDLIIPLGVERSMHVLCSVRTACARLGYTDKDLTKLIRSGQLPSIRHEKETKIRSIVIENFLFNAGYATDKTRTFLTLANNNKELCA